MTSSGFVSALVALVVTVLASLPDEGQARPFVEFGGVVGPITAGRHARWADAESWAPTAIPGQECDHKRGWLDCLERNGHRITVLLRAANLSPAMHGALKPGATFSEVKIEDFDGDASEFSAATFTMSNVRISDVSTSDERSTLTITFAYQTLSHQDEWAEPTILIGPQSCGR